MLNPVIAGAWQRHARMHVVVRRAQLPAVSTSYCIAVIEPVDLEQRSESASPLITDACWDSKFPVFAKSGSWRVSDLQRQQIRIELWEKLEDNEFDTLVGSFRMTLLDFVSAHRIQWDCGVKELDLDLGDGKRLFVGVQITTTPLFDGMPRGDTPANEASDAANLPGLQTTSAEAGVGTEINLREAVFDFFVSAGTLVLRAEAVLDGYASGSSISFAVHLSSASGEGFSLLSTQFNNSASLEQVILRFGVDFSAIQG